jgi:hypothetical protein
MPMPLEGVRVVDWTIWQLGPVASVMLGDLGAEVVKIEERVGGDPGRGVLRAQGMDLSDRPNFYFEANNRNKKSLTVDLKKPEGAEIVRRLADHSDVFVQNMRQGVAARLGLDADTLRARNERLIYASATGYGPEGPDSAQPSFDYLGIARSGIMLAASPVSSSPASRRAFNFSTSPRRAVTCSGSMPPRVACSVTCSEKMSNAARFSCSVETVLPSPCTTLPKELPEPDTLMLIFPIRPPSPSAPPHRSGWRLPEQRCRASPCRP